MWQTPWREDVKCVSPQSTVLRAIADANLGVFVVRDEKPRKRELLCERPGPPALAMSLGLVRSNHMPLQNSEAFALFQPLLDSGCLSIESICDWKGGWRVWMVFEILTYDQPEDLDALRPFLLFGHDPFTNYFKLSYLFVRTCSNGILTEGTFHNPGPSIPPEDDHPRRFSAGSDGACEEIKAHLNEATTTFRRMNRMLVTSEESDRYLLDVADRVSKFRRTAVSDDRLEKLYSECKDRLFRRDDHVESKTQGTLWAAYNSVINWVDREAKVLHDWERVKELWSSSIKDDALYEAILRMPRGE